MKKQGFKNFIHKLHLWLGLGSGLVVFIVSLTGCIYVFQEEINYYFQSGVYHSVEKQNQQFLSPVKIKKQIEGVFPDTIRYMNATVFLSGDKASVVWVRNQKRKYTAFVQNPYTGEIIESFPYSYNFWAIVLGLHTSLLIPELGNHIVSIATIIFLVMLITGIILWFPKSKNGYAQRFNVKWNASPKRLNYDLHNVFGFYITWIIIFIVITGLAMSYQWVDKSIYWIATAGKSKPKQEQVKSVYSSAIQSPSDKVEQTLTGIIQNSQDLSSYYLQYPSDSAACYKITLYSDKGSFYNKQDNYFIDQYSGAILKSDLWENKNSGDKLSDANYNIHVGAILGLPGKITAFFVSLISTSLPVTGFLIWKGRKKKKK